MHALTYFVSITRNLWNWIWPVIIQKEADRFRDWWNNHRVRKQNEKILPSGTTPEKIFKYPQKYSLEHCGVKVDADTVTALRASLPRTREECFAFVDAEFSGVASGVYQQIGAPVMHLRSGWKIFEEMLCILSLTV